ncbi:NUDIX hydrolase [Stackebrandtia nassauensis]|uniref:NUDIX hydrolase n=1 Tax=Stackebrandtia nassauensis (strain DSM 44728 / CIP 108903 / NRRL B-16338 / NBRC 102104 / LLR-40K-21) TaxID=446470 RepID=D3Q1I7_STANL|nr:NUDIX hydrolase [Stackebrandtia nassauensis]ADD39835.1 NUDIX hydrolase [Stackebrandtia nassauensis DSM 44728]
MTEDDGIVRTLPNALAAHARHFYNSGGTPVEPRRAATVLILRDLPYTAGAPGGVEVYMLRRAASMVFAGGMYAFPGGRVDPSDIDVLSAAVREVREETGLRLTELHAWSRWVTPEFEPRRYDTWFYVARLPEGAQPLDISGEADWAGWLPPKRALADHNDQMLPPTAVTLTELSGFNSVDSVLTVAEDRDLTPITPRAVIDNGTVRLALPGDPEF